LTISKKYDIFTHIKIEEMMNKKVKKEENVGVCGF